MRALSFFPRKLGVPKSHRPPRPECGRCPTALFLPHILGAPNLRSVRRQQGQRSCGGRRWAPTVPNGSSFPPVAVGAARALAGFYHKAAVARHH